MKYIWIWMLVIGYGIWTVVSIIDIITTLREWINKNIKTETVPLDLPNHIVPSTVTKKKWTGDYDFECYCWDDLYDSSKIWFIVTLVVIFVVSLSANVISCIGQNQQ